MKKYALIMGSMILTLALALPVTAGEPVEINWDGATSESVITESTTITEAEKAVIENKSKPYLALGADLNPDQLASVLTQMGLFGVDLSGYDVVYVTNEMEHQYLDSYIDPSIIGKRALSSVLVKEAEKGHGVQVVTKNINYCTVDMYRNAMLTAGVSDADIMVVGPTSISGTAALIGALKAYEDMSGDSVSETELDTALDELVTTGELADTIGDSEKVSEFIAYVKAKMVGRKLESREDIEALIDEAATEFGVTLSSEEKEQIVTLMLRISELGLDYDTLIDQAKDIYDRIGDKISLDDLSALADGEATEAVKEAAKEAAKGAVSDFFSSMWEKIKNFFSGIFGG